MLFDITNNFLTVIVEGITKQFSGTSIILTYDIGKKLSSIKQEKSEN